MEFDGGTLQVSLHLPPPALLYLENKHIKGHKINKTNIIFSYLFNIKIYLHGQYIWNCVKIYLLNLMVLLTVSIKQNGLYIQFTKIYAPIEHEPKN